MAGSSWRRRPASSTTPRRRSCARAGSSRASSSSSTSSAEGSSRTRRSSVRCPAVSRTAAGTRSSRCGSPTCPSRSRGRRRAKRSAIFKSHTLDITWPVVEGAAGMERALERIFEEADEALAADANILILSDRAVGPDRVHIPSLLAVSAVHHHLVRAGTRLQTGLVLESGEARSVHSVATLVGYGAAAVNPYLMLETITELVDLGRLPEGMTRE